MPTRLRYLAWALAAVAAVLWLGAAISGGDAEWILPAVLVTLVPVGIIIFFGFRGRFSAVQRLGAGSIILVILAVIGLMIFAAAMAGFSGIR